MTALRQGPSLSWAGQRYATSERERQAVLRNALAAWRRMATLPLDAKTAPPAVTIARIYSQGGNCHWQPRMDSRLAGGVHLVSRLHDVAHDDRGDVLRLEASALDRRLDSRSAEVSGGYVLERTAERADRRADRTRENNSVG